MASDRDIKRCFMCGAWVNKLDLCPTCYRVLDGRKSAKYLEKCLDQVLKRA